MQKKGDLDEAKEFTLSNGKFTSESEKLAIQGKLDGAGTLIIGKNGNLTLCMNDGNRYAYKNYNTDTVIVGKGDTCHVEKNILVNEYATYLASEGLSVAGYYTKEDIDNLFKVQKIDISDITYNNTYVDSSGNNTIIRITRSGNLVTMCFDIKIKATIPNSQTALVYNLPKTANDGFVFLAADDAALKVKMGLMDDNTLYVYWNGDAIPAGRKIQGSVTYVAK
ncbi:MAG TPA: hypothetical protein PLV83_01470 [Bacilli bacterium]|nr:hypothetical protein [Bacilli bacterium]